MTLEELRKEIDVVDDVLLKAFQERMSLVAQVSQAKQAGAVPSPVGRAAPPCASSCRWRGRWG